ncbi:MULTISPECIES: AMP-binding protein [Sphingomonadales]|jgi:propionyl-CoA synthetase|uniref:AMP-dependent synthetase and ligase n=4 Tax=Sphingomonadaceae TaxID=41297 RepID=A2TC85_SPHYA|nr:MULTISPECIES: AMP-binding protein [Sphingomonadaceae]ABM91738.1 AMP-dependent synthetase and ligase [Sphingobium yanoikuyae]MBB4149530.1 propionyl-CoA synthetase [Sphingobium scionense]MDV3480940.1 AMP-binding protein [Sphingobium yanoikuyae]TKV44083.1 propionyl-CoA synthetase [Sphingobium sp. MP9-4]SMP75965.1 propionyl-CoA synthetase [Novosphingobium panipatense]
MSDETGAMAYDGAVRWAANRPDQFWLEAAKAIDWVENPPRAHDQSMGWFPEGILNTCHNCLDRHVQAGRGDALALAYDSPVTGTIRHYTYRELLHETERTAAMLASLGAKKGDRVILYMPMIPETVFAMLACARLGVIHSVVFGGFAPPELAKRIDDATPKLVLTASCGIEGSRTIAYKPLVDEALVLAAHSVEHVVLVQREQLTADLMPVRDIDWHDLRRRTADMPVPPCVPLASGDPLYILYTSGTTGTPKGVVRDNGGHAVALSWSMANIYGIGAGDTFWAASDVGWVVGHSYIVYAPLLVGATTVLFEGKPVGTPDPGTFWRTIARHNVKSFFTAPTAIRAIRKEDPDARFLKEIGTGACRAVFLAGERADPETIAWLERLSGLPVIDHWWQTELGWPAIASCFAMGDLRRKPGSAGFPVPGYQFAILDDDGLALPDGASGNVVIETPLPPGTFRSLWNNNATFVRNFETFPGYYETGDAGFRDSEGFMHIMGRTDDIINIAGHRLSTGQMEEIVSRQPGVAECAVVGADDNLKGMVPIAFVTPQAGYATDKSLVERSVLSVRSELGAIAALKAVLVVEQLPKTRSGKILRSLLRKIVNREPFDIPATIDEPETPAKLAAVFAEEAGLNDPHSLKRVSD